MTLESWKEQGVLPMGQRDRDRLVLLNKAQKKLMKKLARERVVPMIPIIVHTDVGTPYVHRSPPRSGERNGSCSVTAPVRAVAPNRFSRKRSVPLPRGLILRDRFLSGGVALIGGTDAGHSTVRVPGISFRRHWQK